MLIGLLLLVVAESMHLSDDVVDILFSNILARRMFLYLLAQVAINRCSNAARSHSDRCIARVSASHGQEDADGNSFDPKEKTTWHRDP